MINLKQLLSSAIKENAADMFISAGYPPAFKINNKLIKAKTENLSKEEAKSLCFEMLSEEQQQNFLDGKKTVISFEGPEGHRFRLSVFQTIDGVNGVFRRLFSELPVLKDLNLPSSFKSVLNFEKGLVLFSGPLSSGKTTLSSAVVDYFNRNSRLNILTIEDPVEYTYKEGKGLLSQIKTVKNQPIESLCPKIVLIRDIKDIKNLKKAIELVNSGCLVFGEINSSSSLCAVDSLRAVLKNKEIVHLEAQLMKALKVIVFQKLVPSISKELMPISELIFLDNDVKKAIFSDETDKAIELIKIDRDSLGNFSFNQALMDFVIKRKIDVKHAFLASPQPEELDSMLKKAGF